MGEQAANKEAEEPKVEVEKKKEEAALPVEAAAGGGGEEEEEAANKPPPSPDPAPVIVILAVDLHCTGCARRIKRSILRCKGVEGVDADMAANQVTVKGIVDPQALCARIQKKTLRKATVVSPLPPPPDKPEPPPPLVHSQVSELTTVELLVNMHCEACAEQLQKKILKMRGVQTAETNLSAGKLTVTGTMTGDKIAEYIHRRIGKLATVVTPPPPPEPQKEEKAGEKKQDDEGQKEKEKPAAETDKKEEKLTEDDGNKKSGEQADKDGIRAAAEDKKEVEPAKQEEGVVVEGFPQEEMTKRLVYWPYGGVGYKQYPASAAEGEEVMIARRMATDMMPHQAYAMVQWMPPPPPPPAPPVYYNNYMVERPAPQFFSDENPNACIIS